MIFCNTLGNRNLVQLTGETKIWYTTHDFRNGDIAQLVERLNGIEKVRGSTPLISTIHDRV